jgi:hypothetical protein
VALEELMAATDLTDIEGNAAVARSVYLAATAMVVAFVLTIAFFIDPVEPGG